MALPWTTITVQWAGNMAQHSSPPGAIFLHTWALHLPHLSSPVLLLPVLPVPTVRVHRLDGLDHLGLVETEVLRAGDSSLWRRRQGLALGPAGLDLVVDAAEDL